MTSKTALDDLLLKLYLLPPEEEQRILDQWDSLNETARETLMLVLEDALAQQNSMVTKIVEQDPQFVKNLQIFLKDQIKTAKTKDTASNASALASIEQELSA